MGSAFWVLRSVCLSGCAFAAAAAAADDDDDDDVETKADPTKTASPPPVDPRQKDAKLRKCQLFVRLGVQASKDRTNKAADGKRSSCKLQAVMRGELGKKILREGN